MISVVVLFVSFTLFTIKCDDGLIISLPGGQIRGTTLKNLNNNDYFAFRGIPYAAPPIGENRFKEPKEPDPWDGILDTQDDTRVCPQNTTYIISGIPINITEDCLYLNVYTPQLPESNIENLPVLVYIHGGAFHAGSGTYSSNGPKWFMDYGIVVVTLNYRLGALGFLTTMDRTIPGNIGFKDQRFALRWIHKNIHLFGGDPDKVTISGESAGGFSVSYHLLSNNSEGLFRGAIQRSGSAICLGGYIDNPRYYAWELGNILDKNFGPSNSSEELLNVLQQASASDIVNAALEVPVTRDYSAGFLSVLNLTYAFVIENENTSADPFVTVSMHEAFMNGNFHRVPILLGFTSEEAIAWVTQGDDGYPFAAMYDKDPGLLISDQLHVASENKTTAGEELKNIYTNTSFTTDLGACLRVSTDSSFTNGIIRQAQCASAYVPVYLYQFSYMGELANVNYPYGRVEVNGAESIGHAEDNRYLWEFGWTGIIPEGDLLTVQRLHTLWSNFVKYLNPTPEEDALLDNLIWPTVGDTLKYLNINNTLEVREGPRFYNQVNEVLQKYIGPPFNIY